MLYYPFFCLFFSVMIFFLSSAEVDCSVSAIDALEWLPLDYFIYLSSAYSSVVVTIWLFVLGWSCVFFPRV